MSALRAVKAVILGAHQRVAWHKAAHGVNPKQLAIKGMFVDAGEIGQGKARPAQAKGAGTD